MKGVWGNISSLFLVILRWRSCFSGISNLTSFLLWQNELFMEKNNPSVEFTVFFFFLRGLIAQVRKSPAVPRMHAEEQHFFKILSFVVI